MMDTAPIGAITFSEKQFERGHPLTIFLDDKGVLVGSTANAAKYGDQQKALKEMMAEGVVVLICPLCMKRDGVKQADLVPGLKIGSQEVARAALFKEHMKTLSG